MDFFLKKDAYMDLDAITNSEDGSNHFLCSFFYKKWHHLDIVFSKCQKR